MRTQIQIGLPSMALLTLLGCGGTLGSADDNSAAGGRLAASAANELADIGLRSVNGKFVVAEGGGGGVVNANRDVQGPWETFVVEGDGPLADGLQIHLRTYIGRYLVAEEGGGGELHADRTVAGPWETFTIHRIGGGGLILPGDSVALETNNGHYVVAEEGGGDIARANRERVGPWETFTLTGSLRKPSLPPPPTRDQIGAVKMTFQGLSVTLPEYGTIPWFEPAITSLSAADRQIVYAAKHAAGDTHIILAVSWNYSGEPGYSYPVPGNDLTGNLPAFRALVEEAIQNNFYPLIFMAGDGESEPGLGHNDPVGWTYGYAWLMKNMAGIVASLKTPTDLTPYLIFVPGWDGVTPGWAPDASDPGSGIYKYPSELDNYLLLARSLLPNGYLAIELGAGYCHWGDAAANYSSEAGQALDIILQEFPGPPEGDQVFQIAARELGPAYRRPPEEPASDDPHPPYYLSGGTPRGPFFPIAMEYDEYRWVRGDVSATQVLKEQTYLKSVGYTYAN